MKVGEINNVPLFDTKEEAMDYATKVLNCEGYHIHQYEGEEVYMPCSDHSEVIGEIEPSGYLDDLLEDNKIVYVKVIEDPNEISEKYLKRLSSKSLDANKFYSIVSNPNGESILDTPYRRFRFIYSPGIGAPDLIDTSRDFCVRMLAGRQLVFRYEDIMNLSAQIETEDPDRKIIPRPRAAGPVDIWTWKGGAGCLHRWIMIVLEPTGYIYNNASEASINNLMDLPAPGNSGQINLPPNYTGTLTASKEEFIEKIPYEKKDDYIQRCVKYHIDTKGWDSDQSYAVCVKQAEEDFSKDSKRIIIVDIDDTIVHNGKPMMKTLEYIDAKKDDYRIVIISGRPEKRLEETKKQLDDLGVYYDEIYLQDFAENTGGEVGKKFKEYKAKKLIDSGFQVVEAIENDEETRKVYDALGIHAMSPTRLDLSATPIGFSGGYALFENKEDARDYSMFCGCGGSIEETMFKKKKVYQACSKKKKSSTQIFSANEEKKLIYTPIMLANKLIPRIDENGEKYFVTFKPESVEKMAYKYLKEKRTAEVNYEHSEVFFDDIYLVESWIVASKNDKIYDYFSEEQIPLGSWVGAFKVDNEDVWENYIKKGLVKGVSIQGNFIYK